MRERAAIFITQEEKRGPLGLAPPLLGVCATSQEGLKRGHTSLELEVPPLNMRLRLKGGQPLGKLRPSEGS